MGMFDTVHIACPHCGFRTSIQSKAGDCELAEYEVYEAPLEILADIIKYDMPILCAECSNIYKVFLQHMVTVT